MRIFDRLCRFLAKRGEVAPEIRVTASVLGIVSVSKDKVISKTIDDPGSKVYYLVEIHTVNISERPQRYSTMRFITDGEEYWRCWPMGQISIDDPTTVTNPKQLFIWTGSNNTRWTSSYQIHPKPALKKIIDDAITLYVSKQDV